MAKGRKKKSENSSPNQNQPYFGKEQEWAVREFINTGATEEYKNEIYERYLKMPIDKMCESIINTYKLHLENMTFEELKADTISFLLTKMDKFQPSANKKAYSYYGTIIKNRLIGERINEQKLRDRIASYEDHSQSLIEDERYSYTIMDESQNHTLNFFAEFPKILLPLLQSNEKTKQFKPNEMKIGYAIIQIFENYSLGFSDDIDSGGVKYNKSIISENIKELTNLNAKEIRDSMKKMKLIYFQEKAKMINKKESL